MNKTRYEKVNPNTENGSYWECARDFANGIDFYTHGNKDFLVANNDVLLANYKANLLYRKVTLDWQEELIKYLEEKPVAGNKLGGNLIYQLNIKWDLVTENDFIGMCNLVTELTKD